MVGGPPTLLTTTSHGARVEVPLPYHDVPVPRMDEIAGLHRRFDVITGAERSEQFDITSLIDLCLRLTCLAYRRNAPTTATGLALHAAPEHPPHGVELQFRTANGAHAVAYLFREVGSQEMYAVVSFKGSTLSSPAAPFLSDWIANLQAAEVPDGDTHAGSVHAGWRSYLEPLVGEMRACMLPECLPEAVRDAWAWPSRDRLSLWELLRSPRPTLTLLVGHSMGGALATLAATQLASEATAAAAAAAAEKAAAAVAASGKQAKPAARVNPAAGFVDETLRALFSSSSSGLSKGGSKGHGSKEGSGGEGRTTAAAATPARPPPAAAPAPAATRPAAEDDDWETLDGPEAAELLAAAARHDASRQDASGGALGPFAPLLRCMAPGMPRAPPKRRARHGVAHGNASAGGAAHETEGGAEADEPDEPHGPNPRHGPVLVTFGCPVVGDHEFVAHQRRLVRPYGGLRV